MVKILDTNLHCLLQCHDMPTSTLSGEAERPQVAGAVIEALVATVATGGSTQRSTSTIALDATTTSITNGFNGNITKSWTPGVQPVGRTARRPAWGRQSVRWRGGRWARLGRAPEQAGGWGTDAVSGKGRLNFLYSEFPILREEMNRE